MGRNAVQGNVRGGTRGARHSDERLTALFLDMLAAERGAGKNTLAAYGRDLTDFGDYLAEVGRGVATATTDDVRDYLGVLAKRGMQSTTVARRLLGDPSALPFSICGRAAQGRSCGGAGGSKARPNVAKNAFACRSDRLRASRDNSIPMRRCPCDCGQRGFLVLSNSSTPPVCASPNSWRCPRPPRGATPALSSCAARATKNG